MCNQFSGHDPSSERKPFRVSATQSGRTTETQILTGYFRGESDRPFRIVDTQGFNEPGSPDSPNSSVNLKIMTDIMKKLTEVDEVGVFLICLKTISNRITESLAYMLKYFCDIFGYKMVDSVTEKDPAVFWDNCVIAFTQVPMDAKTVSRRKRSQDGMTDDEVATDCVKALAKQLRINQSQLKYVMIDARFDEADKDEKNAFLSQSDKLYAILQKNNAAMTKAMRVAYDKFAKGNFYSC